MPPARAPQAPPPLVETLAREGAGGRSREPGDLPPTAKPITPSWKGVALTMTSRISGLAAVALALAAFAPAAGAAAFTATVRVEGQDATLLPTTTVTLDTAAPKSVHLADNDCDGDTAAAALDQATKGNWDRTQFPKTIL